MENIQAFKGEQQVVMTEQQLVSLIEDATAQAVSQFAVKINTMIEYVKMQSDDRIIDWKTTCEMACIGKTLLMEICTEGKFPEKIALSKTRVGWRHSEVQQWIAIGGAEVWFERYATDEQRAKEAKRLAKAA